MVAQKTQPFSHFAEKTLQRSLGGLEVMFEFRSTGDDAALAHADAVLRLLREDGGVP